VPARLRVEVAHGDAEVGHGVVRQAGRQQFAEDHLRVVLGPVPTFLRARAATLPWEGQVWGDDDGAVEEDRRVLAQRLQQLAVVAADGAGGREDDLVALRGARDGIGAAVLLEGGPRLGEPLEPVAGAGRDLWREALGVGDEGPIGRVEAGWGCRILGL